MSHFHAKPDVDNYIMGDLTGLIVTVQLPYLERGWGVPGEEGLLLILHHLGDDLLLLQPYPGLLPRTHLPQQDSEGINICSLNHHQDAQQLVIGCAD